MIVMDNFMPFFGVVEGLDDPEKMGRVQVRCYGYHSSNKAFIPSDMLNWFSCVVSNSAGVSGVGQSPTGYVKGSTVFGYFLSEDLQDGIVIGSITGKPTTSALASLGFNDPDGVYPLYTNESDVNKLARGDSSHPVFQKRSNRKTGVPIAGGGSWNEPAYSNNANYPDNDVLETKGGHIREMDNTEGNERIHEMHKSGTYYEVDKDGNRVVRVVGDGYEIIAGAKFANVRGNCNLTVEGDVNTVVQGNMNIEVDNKITEEASSKEEKLDSKNTNVSGTHTSRAGTRNHIGNVLLNGNLVCNGNVIATTLIEA